jgi:hypothetical protein
MLIKMQYSKKKIVIVGRISMMKRRKKIRKQTKIKIKNQKIKNKKI